MLVIGSQALHYGLIGVGKALGRVPTDLDIFAREDEAYNALNFMGVTYDTVTPGKLLCKAPDGMRIEVEIAGYGDSTDLYMQYGENMCTLPQMKFYGLAMDLAPLSMLYSLKKSHRHFPRFFEKHVRDYNRLRTHFQGVDVFDRITQLRYLERGKLKTPSLQKSTKDFFDDKVSNRTFIHDQIHEVMAHEERPMFERIKVDPNLVKCSKEKFFALTHEQRDWCVQEEAYVIALERGIIPMLFEGGRIVTPIDAYKWALMRICTTLCSGWFREYALENYDNLMLKYNWTYTHKFLDAVEAGRIERIQK